MRNVYTVKQVNSYIKNMFTQDFMLSRIYLKGEVSNCKYHTSGHIYFSLKDESGTIACVMFKGQRNGLSFRMTDGQQVIVFGGVSTYERDGRYQVYAKEVTLDGAGVLYERFQQLKEQLEEMGMFAAEYKRKIPEFPKVIGIVTAPTGAAIRDIINISKRRNPYVQLLLFPALVQGEGAKESIVKGIKTLAKENVDLIIVGRGGGSMEDLWAFNEEEVARAMFECEIPIISAVGHETDITISDYVADLRAPTPSAAAELAVYDYQAIADRFCEIEQRMKRQMNQKLQLYRMLQEQYQLKLSRVHPEQKLREQRQFAVDIEEKIKRLMKQRIDMARHRLAVSIESMKGLSPIGKLNGGYSYVQAQNGENIKSIKQVKANDDLYIYVTDGMIQTKVQKSEEGVNYGRNDSE